MRRLLTPYLELFPNVDINDIEYEDLYSFLRLMRVEDEFTPSEIDAVNGQILVNMPTDEVAAYFASTGLQQLNLTNQYQTAHDAYVNRWRGTPRAQRTEPEPIKTFTYDMNQVLQDVETAVGHELSPITLAVATRENEKNIAYDANNISKAMFKEPQFYQ